MLRSCLSALFVTALAATATPPSTPATAQRALASLPPRFEPNRGQFDGAVKFASRASDGSLAVFTDGALLSVPEGALRLTLAGSRAAVVTEGVDPLASRSNYIMGNRREAWKFDIPHYSRVRARGVYPGVDLVYYFTGRSLEYDVVVAPGADPAAVRLRFTGAVSTRLSPDGELLFDLGGHQVRQLAPVAYQQDGAARRSVPVRYRVASNGEIGFAVGDYDRRKPLVIDPVLFAGYFQGNGYEVIKATTLDSKGNLWLTGWSSGLVSTLPSAQNTPYQYKAAGLKDVFIAEMVFDATTGVGTMAYWTYIGEASGNEEGSAIAVGSDGKVYIAGYTTSGAYPTVGNTIQSGLLGTEDAIISVIDPSLSGDDSLVFSAYYGGTLIDAATALSLASDGTIYVAGYTSSETIPGCDQDVLQAYNRGASGSWDIFVIHVDPSTDTDTALLYGTFFGGYRTEIATNMILDSSGYLWLGGYTMSSDFPVTDNAYQTGIRSLGDLFVAKLDLSQSGLNALLYCTYIGGDGLDVAHGMVMDSKGAIWLSGYSLSTDFPTTADAYQTTAPGGVSAVLVRIDPSLSSPSQHLTYSTYAGWGGSDVPSSLALMPDGQIAMVGYTTSSKFPLIASTDESWTVHMTDAFLAIFDPTKSGSDSLVYSALYGTTLADNATTVAAGSDGTLYLGLTTYSSDMSTTDGSSKLSTFGLTTSFVIKVDPGITTVKASTDSTSAASSSSTVSQ